MRLYSFVSAGAALVVATLSLAAIAGPATSLPETASDGGDGSAATPDAGAEDASADAAGPTPTEPDAAQPGVLEAGAAASDASTGPSDVGFAAGLRGSFALPFGTAKTVALSDVVSRAIPLGFEAGYFFDRHLYLGVYVLYGFGSNASGPMSTCPTTPDTSCSASQWRFGVMGQWHFVPTRALSPWVGAALGYDIVNLSSTDSSGSTVLAGSLHGMELSLLAGLDFKPLPYLGVGPFAELSVGHYASETSSTALYEWLAFGVRFRTGL